MRLWLILYRPELSARGPFIRATWDSERPSNCILGDGKELILSSREQRTAEAVAERESTTCKHKEGDDYCHLTSALPKR